MQCGMGVSRCDVMHRHFVTNDAKELVSSASWVGSLAFISSVLHSVRLYSLDSLRSTPYRNTWRFYFYLSLQQTENWLQESLSLKNIDNGGTHGDGASRVPPPPIHYPLLPV